MIFSILMIAFLSFNGEQQTTVTALRRREIRALKLPSLPSSPYSPSESSSASAFANLPN